MTLETIVHIIVATQFLLTGILESILYLSTNPSFAHKVSIFKFPIPIAPAPGLKRAMLRGFERKTEDTLMRYDDASGRLIARHTRGRYVRRMAVVLSVSFEPEAQGMAMEVRWGFAPFLSLFSYTLAGWGIMLAGRLGDLGAMDLGDWLFALLAPAAQALLLGSVIYFFGRSVAHTLLGDVEVALEDLTRTLIGLRCGEPTCAFSAVASTLCSSQGEEGIP